MELARKDISRSLQLIFSSNKCLIEHLLGARPCAEGYNLVTKQSPSQSSLFGSGGGLYQINKEDWNNMCHQDKPPQNSEGGEGLL